MCESTSSTKRGSALHGEAQPSLMERLASPSCYGSLHVGRLVDTSLGNDDKP